MNNLNKIPIHDSSLRHSTGQAIYIDDMPELENLLHGAPVLSKIACGKIKKINSDKLNDLPFFTKIITAKDIPGENEIGPIKNVRSSNQQPLLFLSTMRKTSNRARQNCRMSSNRKMQMNIDAPCGKHSSSSFSTFKEYGKHNKRQQRGS